MGVRTRRKGLMDWLFGSGEGGDLQEELAQYSDDIVKLLERMQSEIADLGLNEYGDVRRVEQSRAIVNDLFDQVQAFTQMELEAIAQHRNDSMSSEEDGDDDKSSASLQRTIAALEKAA